MAPFPEKEEIFPLQPEEECPGPEQQVASGDKNQQKPGTEPTNCQGLWHVSLTDGQTDLGESLANIWRGSSGQKVEDRILGCSQNLSFTHWLVKLSSYQ